MAILKAINTKEAGRQKFLKTLVYISNPEKVSKYEIKGELMFKKQTMVNRHLSGKKESKRQFKQFVVSLERTWFSSTENKRKQECELLELANDCEMYFMEKGFLTVAYVHCNTLHPHIHLLLETCSAFTGKQFSQSTSDLADFKDYVTDCLKRIGLNEHILGKVVEMNEEEFYLEEEEEEFLNLEYEYDEDESEECESEWNSGTVEQWNIDKFQKIEMVKIVENHSGREMCRIVESNKGREMCVVVNQV